MADDYTLAVTQTLPDGTLKLYFAPNGGSVVLGDEHPEEISAKAKAGDPSKDTDPAHVAAALVAMQRHHKRLSRETVEKEEAHARLDAEIAEKRARRAELAGEVEALEAAPTEKR